ncbi:hypothetical protein KKF38_04385 [Patescibacteria group bacterium]|nr:hypothetical protein [Patescibacteria group bacterium]
MSYFPGLRASEHVIFFIRKQWTAYIKIVVKLVANLAAGFALFYFFVLKFPQDSITFFLLMEMSIFYLLGTWWWVFNSWLDEELDIIVVTNERIINTTQSAFLAIEVASADLDQIQDVRGKVAGFLGGLFKFGNFEVQTAGSKILFLMDYVEKPERYIDEVIELKNKFVAKKSGR